MKQPGDMTMDELMALPVTERYLRMDDNDLLPFLGSDGKWWMTCRDEDGIIYRTESLWGPEM